MKNPGDSIAQSVHNRLKMIAHERKQDFNALLTRYGNEWFLWTCKRRETRL